MTKKRVVRQRPGPKVETGDGSQMQRKNVMLDDETLDLLLGIGEGNVSEGIRRAARAWTQKRGD